MYGDRERILQSTSSVGSINDPTMAAPARPLSGVLRKLLNTNSSRPPPATPQSSHVTEDSRTEHAIDTHYESLDYDNCENTVFLEEERKQGKRFHVKKEAMRWIIIVLIGVVVGLLAALLTITLEGVAKVKFSYIKLLMESCARTGCMSSPLLLWVGISFFLVLIASLLTVVMCPAAGSSGIPQVKAYLNGVLVSKVMKLKALIVKLVGVALSILGGLAVGQEGPMVHVGSIVGAGISQGNVPSLNLDFKILEYFRNDHDKRDFISVGAAAGIAAAFGTPLTGVLFSLEEGASFWNQALTIRMLLATMVSTNILNIVVSLSKSEAFQLGESGLFTLGTFESKLTQFTYLEVILLVLYGVIGGLLGALFNAINFRLAKFRFKRVYTWWAKVMEAVFVAMTCATISFLFAYLSTECVDSETLDPDENENILKVFCKDGQSSSVSLLVFELPEKAIRSLFHQKPGVFSIPLLAVFSVFYFLATCWCAGLVVPSGIFIPNFLVGAAWGRCLAACLQYVSSPVVTLRDVEQLSRLEKLLRDTTHCGFPVVEDWSPHASSGQGTYGQLSGLILRSQLCVILQKELYMHPSSVNVAQEWCHDFRSNYPKQLNIDDVTIRPQDRQRWIDLKPFMSRSPYTVQEVTSMPRAFKLFRGLGLRHLVVINKKNQVTAMITRKDLAKYRTEIHHLGLAVVTSRKAHGFEYT